MGIDEATDAVFARCNGDHTRLCAWHAVMCVWENACESGTEDDVELVENSLDVIDGQCDCD